MPTQVPEFDQFVQYVTEGADGPITHFVPPQQLSLDTLLTLQALQQGYERAAARGHVLTLSSEDLAALKAAASEVYHQDVVEHEVTSTNPAQVVDNLIVVRSHPEWHVGLECVAVNAERTVGVYFNPADSNLYRCFQAHKAQADWRPDLLGVGALWGRFYEEEWPEWVQPTGAHDAYQKGDKVTFEGGRYISAIDNNVWSPTAYPQGWGYQGPA